jgi:hypothetical protein
MKAQLLSEDTDCPSSLIISGIEERTITGPDTEPQLWQLLSIVLVSGQRRVETLSGEDVLLCKQPVDEMGLLTEQLQELVKKQRDKVLFEPSEPSFELTFTRTPRGGVQVEAWLDAGNGTTDIYTWDAAGIRFMTTDAMLQPFIDQLCTLNVAK